MSRWGIGLSEKMKACKEAEPFTDILEGDGGVPEKDPPVFFQSRVQGHHDEDYRVGLHSQRTCMGMVQLYPCIARTGADRRGLVTGRTQGDHRRGADLRSQGAV